MSKREYYYECGECRGTVTRWAKGTPIRAAAGGVGGAASGAILGGVLGSVVPIVGTAIGAAVGGAVGGSSGWAGNLGKLGPGTCEDCGTVYKPKDVAFLRQKVKPTNKRRK